jgi:hypothetical protein
MTSCRAHPCDNDYKFLYKGLRRAVRESAVTFEAVSIAFCLRRTLHVADQGLFFLLHSPFHAGCFCHLCASLHNLAPRVCHFASDFQSHLPEPPSPPPTRLVETENGTPVLAVWPRLLWHNDTGVAPVVSMGHLTAFIGRDKQNWRPSLTRGFFLVSRSGQGHQPGVVWVYFRKRKTKRKPPQMRTIALDTFAPRRFSLHV